MILQLLRAKQWYKNTVIFLAIIFSGNLFNTNFLTMTILGFISLCLISSVNYILNDIKDIKKDRLHPEKRLRPIPAGKISKNNAALIAVILALISFILAAFLSIKFFYTVLAMFILTTIYTFFLKKIAILDILTISTNFVLRAIAGALLISVWISPFLILCPFFLSLVLSTGKRYSDMLLLKKKELYSKKLIKYLIYSSVSLLIITFTIYSIITHPLLLITIPIIFYALFIYLKLVFSASKKARHPELLFFDKRILLSILLFSIITFIALYPEIISSLF